jgi:hypothetical protein
MFMAATGASPVYKLLGAKGLSSTDFPPMLTPDVGGDLAFRQHSGGHTPAPNWPTFIEFASRYLHAPPVKTANALTPIDGTPIIASNHCRSSACGPRSAVL